MTKTWLNLLLTPFFLLACSPEQQPVKILDEPKTSLELVSAEPVASYSAAELVDIHCVRCHVAPKPEDLSKENWPFALASMGMYLGFKGDELPDFTFAPNNEDSAGASTAAAADYRFFTKLVDTEGSEYIAWGYKEFVLPEPLISVEDWRRIRDYFVTNAPPRSEMYIDRPKQPVLKGFTPAEPELDIEPNGLVFTTAVDEKHRTLYVGRSVMDDWKVGGRPGFEGTDDLLALDLTTGKRLGYMKLATDPIEMEITETGFRLSTHGEHPIRRGEGQGSVIDVTGLAKNQTRTRMLLRGLHRVTLHRSHDLDGDGLEDIIINTYGDGILSSYGGRFAIYWRTPEFAELWQDAPEEIPYGPLQGALVEDVLVNRVGMISSDVGDFNGDGKPDLVALTAQGLQQVTLFVNQGNRTFQQQIVRQYSPAWGLNMVYAVDMDGDGLTDIVTVNGDNTGGNSTGHPFTSSKPKPYHGLRIYRNNGDLTFTEAYFYPMHGALRAVIEDFDGDGDQDAAVIAMWADWKFEEPETFVYLENQGGLQFSPESMPKENFGVWVSIDVGDVNADEKPDIILGLGNWPTLVPEDWTKRPVMQGRGGEAPSVTFLINKYER